MLTIPKPLSRAGKRAAEAILAVLTKHDAADTGGCKAFYSPREWKDRGEKYGTESVLIVVYDGGAHRSFFESEGWGFKRIEEMQAALAAAGFWIEPCTGWYAAVYEK